MSSKSTKKTNSWTLPGKSEAKEYASRVIMGNFVTSEFFARHWMTLFIAVTLIMIYISTKYECLTRMEEIKRCETELAIVKTEYMRQRSTYKSRIRESSMQQLVDSVIPGLGIQKQPPFRLQRPQ